MASTPVTLDVLEHIALQNLDTAGLVSLAKRLNAHAKVEITTAPTPQAAPPQTTPANVKITIKYWFKCVAWERWGDEAYKLETVEALVERIQDHWRAAKVSDHKKAWKDACGYLVRWGLYDEGHATKAMTVSYNLIKDCLDNPNITKLYLVAQCWIDAVAAVRAK